MTKTPTPGVFYNIGKEARDLLYKDYADRPPIQFNRQSLNWSVDVSYKVKEIAPGLSTLFKFDIPDYGKVEMQYENGVCAIAGGIGMIQNPLKGFDPIANFSAVIGGDSLFSIGTDLAFDIATGTFKKIDVGLSLNSDFVTASLSLGRFDTLKASFYNMVNSQSNTALGAELKHSFSSNVTAVTIGAKHAFSPSTLAKARVSTHGSIGVIIQQGLWEKIFLSLSGEVGFIGLKTPELGVSLAVRL